MSSLTVDATTPTQVRHLGTGDEATISIDAESHRARVTLARLATTQLFHRFTDGVLHISTDPRTLATSGADIDPRALYALLQFGAVPPPLSMWRDVGQFASGRVTTIDLRSGAVNTCAVEGAPFGAGGDAQAASALGAEHQADRLRDCLDDTLRALAPDERPVILFSGGVDSGLIAARAAAMGWRDSLLVNYSFGPDDAEAAHARSMAAVLGLPMERITARKADAVELASMFGDLPLPFADRSLAPTTALAEGVVAQVTGRENVIDGTGADGAWGLFGKAQSVQTLYRLPAALRAAGGDLYGRGLYRRTGKAEERLRMMRRSTQLSPVLMSVAFNPLADIAYSFDAGVRSEVHELIDSWIADNFADDHEVRVAGVDLALVCAAIYAQKGRRVYDRSSLALKFPFLAPDMAQLAMRDARHWTGRTEPKWVLKQLLARHVPHAMVYRPKRGFLGTTAHHFSGDAVVDAFRRADSGGPLAGVLAHNVIRRIGDDLAAEHELPSQTYNFVWAVITTDLWWRAATSDSATSTSPAI